LYLASRFPLLGCGHLCLSRAGWGNHFRGKASSPPARARHGKARDLCCQDGVGAGGGGVEYGVALTRAPLPPLVARKAQRSASSLGAASAPGTQSLPFNPPPLQNSSGRSMAPTQGGAVCNDSRAPQLLRRMQEHGGGARIRPALGPLVPLVPLHAALARRARESEE